MLISLQSFDLNRSTIAPFDAQERQPNAYLHSLDTFIPVSFHHHHHSSTSHLPPPPSTMKTVTIIFAVCAVLFSIFMSVITPITCDAIHHANSPSGLFPPTHSHRSSSKAASSTPASPRSPAPSSPAHTTRTSPQRTSVITLPARRPSSAATLPDRQLRLWSSAQSICSRFEQRMLWMQCLDKPM